MSDPAMFAHILKTLIPGTDARRLFHGRGGLYPGFEQITLDWYPPVLLLTAFKPLEPGIKEQLVKEVQTLWSTDWQQPGECNLVFQQRGQGMASVEQLSGTVPEHHVVEENDSKFLIHLLRGQNHGLFLDMRNGRQWVREHARDSKVLNLFSYTCGFSVAAMNGAAQSVVNMDMSKGALAIGRDNHRLNNIEGKVQFFGHDIFRSWGKLRKYGPYDLIVADPPSNQRGSFVASKDYPRLLRKLPELLSTKGQLLLCLNAPELPCDFLQQQVAAECPQLEFVQRLANPAAFEDANPDRALKVLLYRNTE